MFAHGSAAGADPQGQPEQEGTLGGLYLLRDHGYTEGVISKLATDANIGIVGDRKDLTRRRHVFGTNTKPRPHLPTLCESIKETLREVLWWVVGATALLSGICGALSGSQDGGWGAVLEAVWILAAAFFLVAITSMAEWRKDQEFVQLQTLIKDEKIPVVRGKYGTTKTVKVWDLVVGDVVLLGAGARVPADCLAIEADGLEVLEPVYGAKQAAGQEGEAGAGDEQPAEFRTAQKAPAAQAADRKGKHGQGRKLSADDPDPFLLAGSIV